MKNIRKKLFITFMSLSLLSTIISLVLHFKDKPSDYTEYFCGYDDRISFIVEGYQAHWDGFSPEDMELSYIYRYESPYGGFVKHDINGDGTEELLLGDQFENGDYEIYDIFTFNKKNGNIIHLFCGGERDRCTINGSGVIIETGSNSAEDSFTQCYVIRNLRLKKLGKNEPVTLDLLALQFDKFVNYAKADSTIDDHEGCGPRMKVVIDKNGSVGRFVSEDETSYQCETQDNYFVDKSSATVETVCAADGRGWIFLKETGQKPVVSQPDINSDVIGMLVYEAGCVPETYHCKGYTEGWFLVEVDGKTGFIREDFVNWDAINTF